MLKKIFKRKEEVQEAQLTIEDLITLERYEEAELRLRARVKKFPKDLHAHRQLADVYVELKNIPKALDEYGFVADTLAEDGFFDKGIALLSKATKLAPGDDMLPRRIARYRKMKRLEGRRRLAIEGLLSNPSTGTDTAGNSALELELLWNKIAKSHLVEELGAEQLKKLFSVMGMQHTQVGTVLAQAGSSTPKIYLIVAGEVEAQIELEGQPMTLKSFSTGSLVGDSTLFEHRPWPADYVVTVAGTVFQLDREGLQNSMAGNDDPMAFISVLRRQGNDRDVAASLHRLRS